VPVLAETTRTVPTPGPLLARPTARTRIDHQHGVVTTPYWRHTHAVRTTWRLLRDYRDLRFLLGAGVISLTGDWVLGIGLAFYVYVLTGSTLASAGMLLAMFLPSILLSSVAGVFVDRWNRKTTMVVSNLLLAVGLVPLLFVHDSSQVWVVYAVMAWEGTVELFFAPAEQAMIPHLVADSDLTAANALNGQIRDISRLVGSALGGIIVASGGVTALALADLATFVASAMLVARIATSGRAEPAGAGDVRDGAADADADADADAAAPVVSVSKIRALGREWVDGLRVVASHRTLRVILVFSLITTTGEGIMGTLFVPFVRDVLHGSGQEYGLIVSVQAIGGVAGGLVAASLGQRVSAVMMFGVGAMVFGFVDLVMFLYPLVWVGIWPAVACMIVVGVPGAVTIAGLTTVLQRSTLDAYRGRVFGALGAVKGLAVIVGTISAGFLGESVGIVAILAFQGVGYLVAGAVVVLTLAGRPAPVAPGAGGDSALGAAREHPAPTDKSA
jgi:Na+/melibiose symporter-like transporter